MKKMFERKLLLLKPNEIICPFSFARKYYDDYDIKNLADNIAVNGIIEPIIIRKNDVGNYELIAGMRRLKAAKLLGLRRIPCVLQNADDKTAAFISVAENTKRTNLNPFEEADAIQDIINRYGTDNSETAERLGLSLSGLMGKLNLLSLDTASKSRLISSGLNERYARIVLLIPEEKRESFLNEIIANSLSFQNAKELAKKYIERDEKNFSPKVFDGKPVRKVVLGDERLFANSLSKLIETMQNAGVEAYSRKTETEKYIEYRVRIPKERQESFKQLRLMEFDSAVR